MWKIKHFVYFSGFWPSYTLITIIKVEFYPSSISLCHQTSSQPSVLKKFNIYPISIVLPFSEGYGDRIKESAGSWFFFYFHFLYVESGFLHLDNTFMTHDSCAYPQFISLTEACSMDALQPVNLILKDTWVAFCLYFTLVSIFHLPFHYPSVFQCTNLCLDEIKAPSRKLRVSSHIWLETECPLLFLNQHLKISIWKIDGENIYTTGNWQALKKIKPFCRGDRGEEC